MQDPAPEELLNVIRCNCKSTSRNQCGLRTNCACLNNGLVCVTACGGCNGMDCCNSTRRDDLDEDDGNIFDNVFC